MAKRRTSASRGRLLGRGRRWARASSFRPSLRRPWRRRPSASVFRILERCGVLPAHPLEREQLHRPPPRGAADRAAARLIGEQLRERQRVLLWIVAGEDAGVAPPLAARGAGHGYDRTATCHRLGEPAPASLPR